MHTISASTILLLVLSSCGQQSANPGHSAQTLLTDADGGTAPRLQWYDDYLTGKRSIWDVQAQTVCMEQPICTDCNSINWRANPQYCVPDGYLEGVTTALNNFGLDNMWLDSACSTSQVYGLFKAQALKGAHPAWAYQFDETRRTARVFEVRQMSEFAPTPYIWNKDAKTCTKATVRDLSDARYNWLLYQQGAEAPPSAWVPWDDALRMLEGVR